MKTFTVLLSILVSAPAFAQEVTFKGRTPAKGDVRTSTENSKFEISMEIKIGGEVVTTVENKEDKKEKIKTTVLASDGKAVTKVKVEYLQAWEKKSEGPEEKEGDRPVSGKTYIVEMKDEKIVVTDEKGENVPEEEESIVKADNKKLGKEDKFVKWLDGKTAKKGEDLKVPDELFTEIFGGGAEENEEKMKVKTFTMTLTGTETVGGEECGVFDVSLSLEMEPNPGVKIEFKLKGEVVLSSASCWPIRNKLAGPVTASGKTEAQGQEVEFDGEGKGSHEEKFEYAKE